MIRKCAVGISDTLIFANLCQDDNFVVCDVNCRIDKSISIEVLMKKIVPKCINLQFIIE